MNSRFVLVGPPAMGKSSLLRFIPSIVERSTCIDLENTAFPRDPDSLKRLARDLIGVGWTMPLFLGNAAADSVDLALLGYQVIALHHDDHEQYKQRMIARDSKSGSASQGDHWEHHRWLFHEEMPRRKIEPFFVDTLDPEFDDNIHATIRHIANRFQLKPWPDEDPVAQ